MRGCTRFRGGSELFEAVVSTVGLATMVFAAYVAVYKHDLKGLLACSTISHLGLIVFLIHAPPPYELAIWHGLNLPLLMSGAALPSAGDRALLPATPLALVAWLLLLGAGAALVPRWCWATGNPFVRWRSRVRWVWSPHWPLLACRRPTWP